METSGSDIVSRRSALEQFHRTAGSPWIAGDRLPSDFIKIASSWKQNRFSEEFGNGEGDASLQEFQE
jgi:hypothetical protein